MVVDSEESDDEERAELAAQVKQIQRENQEGKQQWWAFCDAEGYSSRRDPNKHNADFLRRFFSLRREGVLPSNSVSLAPQNEPDPEMHKVWVQRVKQTQRSSQDMKTRWEAFCDDQGAGVRDPQRHTCDFMRRFFDELGGYADGRQGAWNAAEGPWAGWSPEAAWAQYYAQWGGNMPAGPPGMPGMWPQPMPGVMPGIWGPCGNGLPPSDKSRKSRSRSRQLSRHSGSTARSSSRSSSPRKVKKKRKVKREKHSKDKKKKTKKKKKRRSSSTSSSRSRS